ncbi:MAG TPA: alpha/beta fold hydrolase [Saprospiraceae bacterium]|nr:alpha/beta fold hydrolase [Saprospiraceae bacterium]
MRKLLLAVILFCATSFLFAQTPVIQEATPIEQIIAELNNSAAKTEAPMHLPYPVIFVHGLVGDFDTWGNINGYLSTQGLTFGGQLAYCLNSDNQPTSNIYSTQLTDIKSCVGISNSVAAGDFYIINFDVNPDCEDFFNWEINDVLSNQAAIVKQGAAIKFAIKAVMQLTGRDKVILFGHSMGGLAARTYLQTSSFWQEDGKHHCAKLITTGTPHLGNGLTSLNLTAIFGWIDENSDALRDMQKWFYTGYEGVFLNGGFEYAGVIDQNYYSKDINCNGVIGNQIEGLNDKSIPSDFDISCIVGDLLYAGSGDGVVAVEGADMKNALTEIHREKFTASSNHLSLPDLLEENILALDEPDDYNLSYRIEPNITYTGYITTQGEGGNYDYDYDDFVFTIPAGKVSFTVSGALAEQMTGQILNINELKIMEATAGAASFISSPEITLPAGTYYFETFKYPAVDDWFHPYTYRVNFTPIASEIIEQGFVQSASLVPNPATDQSTFSATFATDTKGTLTLSDALGRVVQSQPFTGDALTHTFDLSAAVPGAYLVTLRTGEGVKAWKLLKQQ